jgi:hypothetical protein
MAGEFAVIAGEGEVYSTEKLSEWLRQSGWRPLEQIPPLAGPSSVYVYERGELAGLA